MAIPTAHGEFTAHYSSAGLVQLDFPGDERPAGHDAETVPQAREWHDLTTRAIQKILSGRDPADLPPFDLSCGSDFQRRVWKELLSIPAGHTKSYGEIAAVLGDPQAARAVGAACGSNPIPVIIPCHRVLAANGKRGGYSGAAGWKEKLLALEGAQLL